MRQCSPITFFCLYRNTIYMKILFHGTGYRLLAQYTSWARDPNGITNPSPIVCLFQRFIFKRGPWPLVSNVTTWRGLTKRWSLHSRIYPQKMNCKSPRNFPANPSRLLQCIRWGNIPARGDSRIHSSNGIGSSWHRGNQDCHRMTLGEEWGAELENCPIDTARLAFRCEPFPKCIFGLWDSLRQRPAGLTH